MVQNEISPQNFARLKEGVPIRIKAGEYYTAKPNEIKIVKNPAELYAYAADRREIYPHTWLLITLTEEIPGMGGVRPIAEGRHIVVGSHRRPVGEDDPVAQRVDVGQLVRLLDVLHPHRPRVENFPHQFVVLSFEQKKCTFKLCTKSLL